MGKSIYPDWLRGFGERADYKLTGREWREFAKIADHIDSLESELGELRARLQTMRAHIQAALSEDSRE